VLTIVFCAKVQFLCKIENAVAYVRRCQLLTSISRQSSVWKSVRQRFHTPDYSYGTTSQAPINSQIHHGHHEISKTFKNSPF